MSTQIVRRPGIGTVSPAPDSRRGRTVLWILCFAILVIGIGLFRPVEAHLRVVSLVQRFSNPQAKGIGTQFARHPFREETGIAQSEWGLIKYRIYAPVDCSKCGGVVLLHGIHRLGIEEPRLVNFSRALAGAGVEVMTPELRDLADYRVTLHTSDEIGYSAEFLSRYMKKAKVGVMGLSFAGGLALLAAGKPQYTARIGFVMTIGAHDDLARVARFLATGIVEKPDGSTTAFAPHEYGALVVAYSHIEDFFSSADVVRARGALRMWLSEMPEQARHEQNRLTPQGRERFEQLLYHRERLRELLLRSIQVHADELAAASPAGHLANLGVRVYLLHGSSDNVIPPAETTWLEREIPRQMLKGVLISPAITHADIEQETSLLEKWRLVHFFAQVLISTDQLRSRE